MRSDGRPRKLKRSSRRTRHLCFVFGALVCILQGWLCAQAQEHATEAQVKSAYLYNFGKFVRWRASAETESFDICVLGRNPFGSALSNTVAGERIDGKNIVVRNVLGLEGISHCKILFISTSEEPRLKASFAASTRAGILTVSDIPGFAERGGMIGFVNAGGKIRFEVNVAAVSDAGLTVSSELLKVAVRVIGANPQKEIAR